MKSGRRALVTGANRGIGQAIARGLVERGLHVLASCRGPEDARRVAASLGEGAVGVTLELADPLRVEAEVRRIEDAHGPIDVLVNDAAVLPTGRGLEAEVADLVEALAVNTVSPFALIRGLGPRMQARGYGRIVNLSSGWGAFSEGMDGPLAYAVSKAALNALTLGLAGTLGPDVKINAVCPGWVRTRMGGAGARRTPEEGASTPIWLATLPDNGPTGGFFRDRRRVDW